MPPIVAKLQLPSLRWPGVFLLVAVAFALGVAGDRLFLEHNSTDPFAIKSDFPPAEYLYLDNTRILAFLSQLNGGLTSSEKRTLTHLESLKGGATGSGFEAGGTSQDESALETSVTPTAASQFYRLESLLRDKHYIRRVSAQTDHLSQFVAALDHEGEFVFISGSRLKLPNYARLYQYLKGPPILPLRLVVSGQTERVNLLLPISYRSLANEPSLFSSELSVVGKIVRVVDEGKPRYVDAPSLLAFRQAVGQHRRRLQALHLPAATIDRQFRAAVTLDAPGAVVLPVAIFD